MLGGGAKAATVPTVSSVKEFSQTKPILLVEKTKNKKVMNIVGGIQPQAPGRAISAIALKT